MSDDCEVCSGKKSIDEIEAAQREYLEKYGWYAHYVALENGMANYHTHGLDINFQIVVPILPTVCHSLFNDIVERFKGGEQFVDGKEDAELLSGYSVLYKSAEEDGRHVLRVILPDRAGVLRDSEDAMFAAQWIGIKKGV